MSMYNEVQNGFFVLSLEDSDDPEDIAAFKTCSGLSYETEIITSEQNLPTGMRSYQKRPGRINFGDIEFERGLVAEGKALFEAIKLAEKGTPNRQNMAIKLYRNALDFETSPGEPVVQWDLTNAWISGWSLSDLDAESDDVLVQTLRITHERLETKLG